MITVAGIDIWEIDCDYIIIPTNCQIRKDGTAVMGAGLAKQASDKYSRLQYLYGKAIQYKKDKPKAITTSDINGKPKSLICFPTKIHWKDSSSIELIKQNAILVSEHVSKDDKIALPKLGCGLGGLNWEIQVKPMLENILDGRFIVCV